jgi:Fe-S-cluster containining protein
MTRAEAAEVRAAAAPEVHLAWEAHPADSRFVVLRARPCPLLRMEGALATCAVWAVRPMNCRRYGCGREDVRTEPYDAAPIPVRFYTDRAFRRQMVLMQRKAQRWGRAHGWEAHG